MDRFSAHMDRAWDLMSKGLGLEAMLAARQALGIDALSPEAHNLLGCIYAMDGDFNEALDSYQRAMELDDDYLDPILNSAELLLHSRASTEEAIALCDKARSLVMADDEMIEILLLEVDAFLSLGQADTARSRLMEVDEIRAPLPYHNMLIGRAFLELEDLERAKTHIDHAIEQAPNMADAWHCRGLLERERGRRINAVEAFLRVLEEDRNKSPLPWIEQLASTNLERQVKNAIENTPDDVRNALREAEIIIVPLPSIEQVRSELDPRQPLWADEIDLENHSFKRLWVFFRNIEYAGISQVSFEEGLIELIESEITQAHPHFY